MINQSIQSINQLDHAEQLQQCSTVCSALYWPIAKSKNNYNHRHDYGTIMFLIQILNLKQYDIFQLHKTYHDLPKTVNIRMTLPSRLSFDEQNRSNPHIQSQTNRAKNKIHLTPDLTSKGYPLEINKHLKILKISTTNVPK